MKTSRTVLLCAALLAFGTAETNAQGLGGLIKKVKKGVESVTGAATGSASGLQASVTDVPIEGGGTIRNPLSKIVDIQLVGAYGKSTSTNYGEVSLVFKVKMISNLSSMGIGFNSDLPGLMIDQDGNTYKPRENGWHNYDVTEGVYMNIPLNKYADFVDVKRTATVIQQLQIGVSTSYNDKGLIVLKNVPIQWDVE